MGRLILAITFTLAYALSWADSDLEVKTPVYEINMDSLTTKMERENIYIETEPMAKTPVQVPVIKSKQKNWATTANFGQLCENVCGNHNCDSWCTAFLAPGEPEPTTCQTYFQRFSGGNQNRWDTTYSNQICDLDDDTDFWSFEVDIEFFVADRRTLKCNANNFHYRKREVGQVSCSFWTGLFNESRCVRRVENKFAELGSQSYAPHPNALSGGDVFADLCP